MKKDKTRYYEIYSLDGNLVMEGTSEQVHKMLGFTNRTNFTSNLSFWKAKGVDTIGDYEVVVAGELRRVFDAYRGLEFLCTGTFQEIAEVLDLDIKAVKYASSPAAIKRAASCKSESEALVLLEHEKPRIDYY